MEQRTTNDIVNKLATKNTDMKGRRCVMAGDAVDPQDYVTLNDLNTAIDNLSQQGLRVTPFPAKPHQFLNSVNSNGVFTAAQPSFNDISGIVGVGQIPPYVYPPITDFSPFTQQGVPGPGARLLGVIYQNTTGHILYISVSVTCTPPAGSTSQAAIKIGPDSTVQYWISKPGFNSAASTSIEFAVTFLVPINWWFQVYAYTGSVSIDQWVEWW